MNVLFRVDSSELIGSGHLMRCLTLAKKIKAHGGKVSFICRDLPGNMANLVVSAGFQCFLLPHNHTYSITSDTITWLGCDWHTDALETVNIIKSQWCVPDWVVVDHYGIDFKWEQIIRRSVKNIIVIDDLANRIHECQVLIDQNFYINAQKRYHNLVPEDCKLLLGPQHVLLRNEFEIIRKKLKKRDGCIHRLLIFFGSGDPTNETEKALEAVRMLKSEDIMVDVVVGTINPHKEHIREICTKLSNAQFYCQVDNMAQLLVKTDLAIGAGGTTMWERCYLGLPAIIISVAQNQIEVTSAVASTGCIEYLGESANVSSLDLFLKIKELISNPGKVADMSARALALIGNPESSAVINIMEQGRGS